MRSAELWRRRSLTIAGAMAGLLLWWGLGLPLPFLFGPMLACMVMALMRLPITGLGPSTEAARTVLGLAIGASITPELLAELPRMTASLAFVPLQVVVIGLVGVPFFRRFCGFDPITAFYAAMPGGATDMMLFGRDAGADVRALSLIHATRVAMIVVLAPLLLSGGYGISLDSPPGAPLSDVPLSELALMVVAAFVGWQVAKRIGLFGASILGPLIAAMILSLSNLIEHRPPAEAIQFAQFAIGISIGVHYLGVSLRELRRTVAMGAVFMLILVVLAGSVAEIVILLGLAPPVDAFLAFAPGGQAEMAVLAIMAGADLGFIALHHLVRIVLVLTGAPVVARLLRLGGEGQRGGK